MKVNRLMTSVKDHLKQRRSALSMTLEKPGPDDSTIRSIIEIACRVPDHGKLAPWRFEVWEMPARENLHNAFSKLLAEKEPFAEQEKWQKGTDKLLHAPLVIAVISTASEHPKIPYWEQVLSVGAACMNLLHAANAHGYEAQWLTAWYVYDDAASQIIGLGENEQIAGLVHIGSTSTAKSERPRPDIDTLLSTRKV